MAISLKSALFSTWIVLNNVYAVAGYLGWVFLLLPLRYINSGLFWRVEAKLFGWLMASVAHWLWSAQYTVEEQGDAISQLQNEECLILSNHLGMGDTPVLMYMLQHYPHTAGRALWILWKNFRFTNFGLVSMFRGDYFIGFGKETLINLGKHLKNYYSQRGRKWIILFPEGAFLRNVMESSRRFAEKNGYPPLENVSLPRMGALQTVLDTLNTQNGQSKPIKYIIDVTLGYPDNIPLDIPTVMLRSLPPHKVQLYYRVYPVSQLPSESGQLQQWAYSMWQEKDSLLSEFYRTGSFPERRESERCEGVTPQPKRHLVFSSWWLPALQAFFLLSCCLQYRLLAAFFSFVY